MCNGLLSERGNEGMRSGFYPLIPMLVHKISNDTPRDFIEVGIAIFRFVGELDVRRVHELLTILAVEVSGDPAGDAGYLTLVGAIGKDADKLHLALNNRKIGDALPVFDPARRDGCARAIGERFATRTIAIDKEKLRLSLVVLDTW